METGKRLFPADTGRTRFPLLSPPSPPSKTESPSLVGRAGFCFAPVPRRVIPRYSDTQESFAGRLIPGQGIPAFSRINRYDRCSVDDVVAHQSFVWPPHTFAHLSFDDDLLTRNDGPPASPIMTIRLPTQILINNTEQTRSRSVEATSKNQIESAGDELSLTSVQFRGKLVSVLAIIFMILIAIHEIIQHQILVPEISALAPTATQPELQRLFWNARLPYVFFVVGTLIMTMLVMQRFNAGSLQQVSDLAREVGLRRKAEAEMRSMAHRDTLTQLPNRPYLIERLQQIVEQEAKQLSARYAVLFLDLDNFKIINDSLGHDAGDDLLGQVAGRLQRCVRKNDTAMRASDHGKGDGKQKTFKQWRSDTSKSEKTKNIEEQDEHETVRLGGDEFVVLLERLSHPKHAMEVAERIVRRVSEPFSLSGKMVSVGASVGIAFVDRQTKDASDVLRNADTAMYRAKNAGKGQVAVFDESMHAEVLRRLERESQLRRAISEKLFRLHYQPIVNLHTAEVQGVEVLLRWTDDSGQIVSPGEFIPIIEEIGMIGEVGEWVLQTAIEEMNQVLRAVPGDVAENLAVGVNTSPRQLADPFFIDLLDQIIDRTGFDRKRLKLEMGEAQDVRHAKRIRSAMLALHERGIGIQIDDFGKGQSSLTSFQNYSIESVKIDRSFTRSIATDRTHAVIAESIVSLAHHLSAKIVAEGVESVDQLTALRSWGCDAAQGYLFSPPLSCSDLIRFLSNPETSEGIRLLKEGPVANRDGNALISGILT